MNINYFKQNVNSAKSSSFSANGHIHVIVGKKMSTGLVQIAFYKGFQGSMIAKGYVSINNFFNIAHMNNTTVIFNKRHFKNLL